MPRGVHDQAGAYRPQPDAVPGRRDLPHALHHSAGRRRALAAAADHVSKRSERLAGEQCGPCFCYVRQGSIESRYQRVPPDRASALFEVTHPQSTFLRRCLKTARSLRGSGWVSAATALAGRRHSRPTQYAGRRLRFMTARIRMLSGLTI